MATAAAAASPAFPCECPMSPKWRIFQNVVVGVAILAGARFARWFWWLFAARVTLAFVFVLWLISQSIFVLGTLCPWCMVTWVVTIPTFYAVTLHVLRTGIVPAPPSKIGGERVRLFRRPQPDDRVSSTARP